ncbi:MAG: DEAD/DEAH box helicase family protein [Elusimicrobiota bacterium]|nr:DEAD/DEAH box helicase family protein [Elusimicrobiota bacterium]
MSEILNDIEKNRYKLTYRKYETFFDRLGMLQRRNFPVLKRLDNQLKKHNITLWIGKEPVKKITFIPKGETITFRCEEDEDKIQEIEYQHAGTVNIENSESKIELYQHQKEAFSNLQNSIIKSNKDSFAGLLVLPTGGGKTLTAAYWIAKNILDKNKKVLWVAHRHELLAQAQKTFAEKLAYKDIFTNRQSFNYRILSGIHDKPVHIKPTDDIIISSKDSLNTGFSYLHRNWIEKNNASEIFLVVDEAHHATAKTYRKLISKLKSSVAQLRILGLTATPFRTATDEQGLLKKVFPDDIVYKIDLRSLIRLGILSEPHFEEISTGQDIIKQFELSEKQIRELNSKFGDFSAILGDNISTSIANNKERNHTIVNQYVTNKRKYKQTIVFALNVDNAIALNTLFKKAGVKSDYIVSSIKDMVTGVTISNKDNKRKMEKFRREELEVLINVEILTEGVDVPNVQSVFLARQTVSTILMTQMIGRGLRGPKAGGTKEAYIVSFVDDWQNKIAWVNPEKLFIEENVDFKDDDVETKRQIIRLVAISKIEEFAILSNQIIEPQIKEELEKLAFIERIPLGIFHFRFLKNNSDGLPEEKICEVLVYDNVHQAYMDFVAELPHLFNYYGLNERNSLTDEELDYYAAEVEQKFFNTCLKYPAYHLQDIKDILQYYAIQDVKPTFIDLKDREKYDVDKIAESIVENNLSEAEKIKYINQEWSSGEIAWQTFFNFSKKLFLDEIDLAKRRYCYPELYGKNSVIPQNIKELRKLEELNLHELTQTNPEHGNWLKNEVFKKYTDKNGFYFCANSGYRSKNKLDFQIDHIKPISHGGLTVLENLQLLTRKENARKGAK